MKTYKQFIAESAGSTEITDNVVKNGNKKTNRLNSPGHLSKHYDVEVSKSPEGHPFKKVQKGHLDNITAALKRNGDEWKHFEHGKIAQHGLWDKGIGTSHIAVSNHVTWHKAASENIGAGQNRIIIKGHRMPTSDFVSQSPEEQDKHFKS